MKAFIKLLALIIFLGGVGYGTVTSVKKAEARAAVAPAATSQAGAAAPRPPLSTNGLTLVPTTIQYRVSAVGSLVANESVEVSSELSRKLVSVKVQEGQKVTEGEVLFELDATQLNAQLGELEARLKLAQLNEQRIRTLLESQTASQAEYDQFKTELDVVNSQIFQVKTQLDKTVIRAPFAGRAGLRRASVGAWIEPESPLITIQDTSRIKVDFKVPERYAVDMKQGMTFRFRPEGRGEWTEGSIVAVEPAIEANTRSLIVRGVASNADESLIPGAFVTVEVPTSTIKDGLLVPTQAVVPSSRGSSVFVERDGKAVVVPIEIGIRNPDTVQVISGLKAGDVVLTSNLLRLRPGAPVQVVTSN